MRMMWKSGKCKVQIPAFIFRYLYLQSEAKPSTILVTSWGRFRCCSEERYEHGVRLRLLMFCSIVVTTVGPVHGLKNENPYKKSSFLQSIARHVNSDPNAMWYSSPSLAGVDPRNENLLRSRRSVSDRDWRVNDLLRPPEDQNSGGLDCGSCWAFASTHAFDDHRSIEANKRQVPTSMQRMVSCCRFSGCNGCGGGFADSGFRYLKDEGSVPESCQPYNEDSLVHPKGEKCQDKCIDGTGISIGINHQLNSFAPVEATESKIREALDRGPLVTAMSVYTDFYTFMGNGIYHHVDGHEAGGHLVEMVGYGSENGQNYWICKNSWGTEWGDGGYFRIKAGEQESDIEQKGNIFSPFGGTGTEPADSRLTITLVGVNTAADVEAEDVIEAAWFAAYELNPFCPGKDIDRTIIHNLTLLSVHRASRKVVAGQQLNVIATYQEPARMFQLPRPMK